MPLNVLVVIKGHPYDYNSFHAMFDENPNINDTFVDQPAAQVLLRPENVAAYDCVFFYDMWGIRGDGGDGSNQPSADFKKSMEALLESGKGLVLANHALVQWPDWPFWREMTGTSFMLTEGEVFGEKVPGSGYRGGAGEPQRNATHHLSPVAEGHPVLEGLGDGFEITDEIYLKTPGFEAQPGIVPLLRSNYEMVQANFNPPPLAPAEEKARWEHPMGSNLIAWAKKSGNSPIVAMDCGDGPAAYANPAYRKFLENALRWVASDEAKTWARS